MLFLLYPLLLSILLTHSLSLASIPLPNDIRTTNSPILSDLNSIANDLHTFTADIKSFNGGLLDALPLSSDASDIEQDLRRALKDAQTIDASTIPKDERSSFVEKLKALEPDVIETLDLLNQKKSTLEAASLSNTVLENSKTFKDLLNQLYQEIRKKATPEEVKELDAAAETLNKKLDEVIAAFKG